MRSAFTSALHLPGRLLTPWFFCVPLLAAALTAAWASADTTPLTAEDRAVVIDRICTLLEEEYVFADTAAQCSEHLRELALQGAFESYVDPEQFGSRLTDELRVVSRDKHLLVRLRHRVEALVPGPTDARPGLSVREHSRRREHGRQHNFGFERVERLDGNIGYLDLRYFAGPADALATATAAMGYLANTDALVFDLRNNGGGSPGMVHFLSSYLFEEPTHLNSFYYRDGDRIEEFWTLPDVPGPKMTEVPVFVLTGPATFSGAEEFSYNLRTQERGTLVGETTRGGANPGDLFPIDAQLEIFIPIGRAINPITGTNWEGVGVKPHVEVPAEEALEKALELARPAAAAYRAAVDARWDRLEATHAEALQLDAAKNPEDAARRLIEALREARQDRLLGESEVNQIGYDLLGQERASLAIAALQLNVELNPDSANAHDSLGEAHRAAGHIAEALQHYLRAVDLQPDGPGAEAARQAIGELRAALDREG